ncbi:MAG TPA: hypothetical protein VJ999_10285 [Candidatus Sulfotelmatobacter sp.]|nr:hypothetical protein [Candidatus Sulfotelmatobacter sp.]
MDLDEEREGYINPSRPAYPPIHSSESEPGGQHQLLSARAEEVLGGLITVAGGVWAVYAVAVERAGFWQAHLMPPGPAEICALGVLVWLHAKWRHAKAA